MDLNVHYEVSANIAFGNDFYIGSNGVSVAGSGTITDFNGYRLRLNSISMNLVRLENGSVTNTIVSRVFSFSTGTTYAVDINRITNGTFSLSIDQNFQGSAVDTFYTDFNFIHLQNSTGAGNQNFDNLNIKSTFPALSVIHRLLSSGSNQVCVTVEDLNLLSTSLCKSFTVGNFKIILRDENTLLPIPSATVTLNGNPVDVNSNGRLDLNTTAFSPGLNVIVASTPTKSQRSWVLYSDGTTGFDLNLLLLDTNKGTNISFIIKDSNGTLYPDSNIVIMHKKPTGSGNNGDYNVSSGFTDSLGIYTAFLNPNPSNDGNYLFIVNFPGRPALVYDDSNVFISVPLDEEGLFPLIPFNVTIGGVGGGGASGLTVGTSFRILSNTVSAYIFTIDRNSDYYARNYAATTMGGADLNIQPYLSKVSSSSIIAFTIKQLQLPTLPIPNVIVQLKKSINGITTLLESAETDASGTITFSMINGDSYFLNFFYQGSQVCNFPTSDPCNTTVNTTFTQYNVLIDVNNAADTNDVQLTLYVTWTPENTSVTSCLNCTFTLSQTVQSLYGKYVTVKVTKSDGTLISIVTRSYTTSLVYDIFNETIDSNAISSIQWINVDVIVQGQNDENQTLSNRYTVNQTNTFLTNLRNLKTDLGDVPLIILSVFLTILITGSMGIFFRDSGLTVLMSAIIMAFFTFGLGWVPIDAFAFASLAGLAGYIWYERQGT